MVSYMEELLDVKFGRKHIPGTLEKDDEGVIYVQDNGSNNFDIQIESIFEAIDKFNSAQDGGISNDNCRIFLPTGILLHAIYYRIDTVGWRHDIEAGAKSLGLLTATIKEDKIVLSDGRSYKLSDCKIEDDLRSKEDGDVGNYNDVNYAGYQESEEVSKYRAQAILEQIDALIEAAQALLKPQDQKFALEGIYIYKDKIQKDPKLWKDFDIFIEEILKKNKIKVSKDMKYYFTIVGEIMQLAK